MKPKAFLHFLLRHLPLIMLAGMAAVLWLVDTYTDWFVIQRTLHWMDTGPVGWGVAAIGLVLTSLLIAFLQRHQADRLLSKWGPAIRVVTASGEAIRISLTEKKYPTESYWSGNTTDAGGETHQLVICQPSNSVPIAGHQVTMSLLITSARESVAAQFNERFPRQTKPLPSP